MIDKKLDYKKYYGKFVIFRYQKDFYLAKFNNINDLNRVDLDFYIWDVKEFHFDIKSTDILTINEVYVISSYDTIEAAKNAYSLYLDTNKFNV